MAEKRFCPNCGIEAQDTKQGIFCETCDATFKVTKAGPRVDRTGVLEQINERLTKIEQKVFADIDEPEAPAEPEPTDDEDIL